ncbi:Extradiol ring-cleavage dioxygenase, class III enzyme, subunit B [Aspergillus pseudotamarii]|uniref:Extradiol ring-cleavage dioxygenase, class III enzyme, subunit B n=1 Tax=Aspergillus pseudotamarii TaxID=132259 RepID=A0A5N6SD22_ASPPS|nr:Extradiol ring-cleavage dioxygenase, class III enzyme, subunit B [Aspergillus pseudotamarii]KAE8132616.1 Extradiol ring-cleavage dioxygenase, class III enzyme, subunit B [Aspergillus pseudotamarii]
MSSQPTTTPTQQATKKPSSTLTALSILTVLIAVSLAFFIGYNTNNNNNKTTEEQHLTSQTANLFGLKRFFTTTTPAVSREISKTAASRKTAGGSSSEKMSRTPIYFLSHGGPNVMYQTDHPAYKKLGQIGKEITTKVKPKAVVVFSAHWQAGRDMIQVNTAEITDLIYDFYGFPSHYYKEKYPNVGSREVANKVLDLLGKAGIKAEGVKRGLDHGVWASFKCAFEPESNPLNVPIVQVSLFNNEDPVAHYRLGQAVSSLRDENILIIVSGMAVHNLRDLWFSRNDSRPLPYTTSFDEALKKAATAPPAEREQAMADLLKRPDARQAHPTFEHLLPIHIGAGAAGDDVGKRLWTMGEGSMSWAQFRFGQVANSSSSL